MTQRQTLFVIIVGIGILVMIMELIRQRRMREKYSMLWVFIAFVMCSVPFLYNYYAKIGQSLGIREANSFFFYCAIMGLVLLSLQFSISISTAYRQRKTLSQQIALLEKRLYDLETTDEEPMDRSNKQIIEDMD